MVDKKRLAKSNNFASRCRKAAQAKRKKLKCVAQRAPKLKRSSARLHAATIRTGFDWAFADSAAVDSAAVAACSSAGCCAAFVR